jgi:hypothetical protein
MACDPVQPHIQATLAVERPKPENVGPQVLLETVSLPWIPYTCAPRAADSSGIDQQDPRVRIRV